MTNGNETPMKAWFYMLLFLPGAIIFGFLANYIRLPTEYMPQIPIIIALASFSYSAWKTLSRKPGRPSPLAAALPLFIPILNTFWIYRAIYPLGRAIKEDADSLNMKEEVGDAFSRAFCHFQIATIATVSLAFVLSFMGTASSALVAVILAGLLFILWLAVTYVMFFHYSRLLNSIAFRQSEASRTTPDAQQESGHVRK
jgi:hypothetical protein